MNKTLPLLLILGFLCGCTQKVTLVKPGYYQQGQYRDASYQLAYYDVYGHLHTEQEISPSYLAGRFHRASYHTGTESSSNQWRNTFSGNWLTQSVAVGAAGGAAIAGVLDGGASSLIVGGAVGAISGKILGEELYEAPVTSATPY